MGMLNKKWGLLLLGAWMVIGGVLGLLNVALPGIIGVIVGIVAGALIVIDK
jgi:hypothetical protein